MLSTENYDKKSKNKISTWNNHFTNNKVDIHSLNTSKGWKKVVKGTEKYLDEPNQINQMVLEDDEAVSLPYPSLVFNAFNLCKFKSLKVVILGQDPYFNIRDGTPEAMGLSFSVPKGINIPSSLNNIFKNLVKYDHLKTMPSHGNLESWAQQGILLLNTALTVQEGHPNIHSAYWQKYTDHIIKKISDTKENIIFVLWGSHALNKNSLIDESKHKIIASSHPSGLSCNRPLRNYPSFVDQDHFGLINIYLKSKKIKQIDWIIN